MEDCIEKTLVLKAPIARVWRSLTDHKEFGQWFQVRIDKPFEVGVLSTGQITHPACEHEEWKVMVNTTQKSSKASATTGPPHDAPGAAPDRGVAPCSLKFRCSF